jgi:hypothetical protein
MKKNILLEQFQKQKIPYCWNSFKIKNKKYHTVGTVSKSKTKNTILLEQPVSNSKTKNTILLEQFQNQKQKYHTVGTAGFKFKNKNTILLEQFQNQKQKYHTVGTVSKSKTKIPYCWNSFKIKIGERSKTIPLIYT